MHARVILGRVKLKKQDEARKIYKESVEPAAKEQKGFMKMLLLTDPETSKFISITIWETEKDMVAGESSGYLQKQLDKIVTLFVGPPSIQHYVVSD
ncbi:MAG: antibiotic biosynthesis monooxygenase [Thermodesulfobacteriota bacterium]